MDNEKTTETGETQPLALATSYLEDAKIAEFSESPIHDNLLKALSTIGWERPTPVQSLCLPFTLVGRNLAGFAQTGTGKTGVFLLSAAHKILTDREKDPESDQGTKQPQVIILAPTRELALQISHDAEDLMKTVEIKVLAVFGGMDYEKQAKAIQNGVDIIVATPGRLKDYLNKKVFDISHCQQFICDEADRMFDMGFIEDVEYFLSKLSENTQKLLFSATTNDQVKELAFEYLENPEYISVNPETITPENIVQKAIICESYKKVKVLIDILKNQSPERTIIFTNTKVVAEWLHFKLTKNNFNVDMITGDLPQKKRISLIKKIKAGDIKALIATDVASRGLHISGVTHVVNFDLPDEAANYIHRIGRTARAGEKGISISFVCEDYGQHLETINEMLGEKLHLSSEWYDQTAIDAIEDISGNPFDDPEFRLANQRSRESSRASAPGRGERSASPRRRGASRSGPTRQPPEHRERRPHSDESRDSSERSAQSGNRSSKGRRRNQAAAPRKNRPGNSSHRRKRNDQISENRRQGGIRGKDAPGKNIDNSQTKVPQTFGGMVKRFFGTLFGKRKSP